MAGPENWLGINLGDIIAQSEQIKASQQARQMNQFRMEQARQQQADEMAKRDAYRQLFTPAEGAPGGYNPEGIAALGAVDPEAAFNIKKHLSQLSADQREMEGKKYTALAPLVLKAQKMPYQARRGFIAAATPYLQAHGWTPEEIAAFDPTDQNVQALGVATMTVPQVLDSMKTDWKQIGGDQGGLVAFDSMGNPVGSGNPYAGAAVNPQASGPAPDQGGVDQLFSALIQQESGGKPGVLGPQTDYGRAEGMTQMLPDTARGMAQKLGIPWRPELMTGKSPEAAQYQQALGRAYLEEGLQKYGGDPRKALLYYHGGPNERLWGPKTNRYADQVLARINGTAQPGAEAIQSPPALAALPQGASPGYIPGRGKPQARPMTPQEIAAEHLPPGNWYRGPDGKPELIQGSGAAETFKNENTLRDDFDKHPIVQRFQLIRGAALQVKALANSVPHDDPGRAQADMSLIFAYMRANDPTSTVREGEYATAQNAAGIPDRIRNLYNGALTGAKLNPTQRQGMVRATMDMYRAAAGPYNEQAGRFQSIARRQGVTPEALNQIAPFAGNGYPDKPDGSPGGPEQLSRQRAQKPFAVGEARRVQGGITIRRVK